MDRIKEKDIHSELIDVSHTGSGRSGMNSSVSNASDGTLQVPIPAPRRILKNVPVATPTSSNVASLDMSDFKDGILSLSNVFISAGPEWSISSIGETENVDTVRKYL